MCECVSVCVCVCVCDVRPRAPAALVGRLVGVGEVWGFLRLCRKFFVFFFQALTGRFFCAWPVLGGKYEKNVFWGQILHKYVLGMKIEKKKFSGKNSEKNNFFRKIFEKKVF